MTSLSKIIKKPRINPEFYCNPDKFSFKDLLAICFTAGFFYASYRALSEPQALELVKSIAYLMAVILGGYFGHEITAALIHERYRGYDSAYNGDYSYGGDNNNGDSANANQGNGSQV